MVRVETPLHPRIHKMLEAISQRDRAVVAREMRTSLERHNHCGIGAILRQPWDLTLGSV